jgi:hypothetical protein
MCKFQMAPCVGHPKHDASVSRMPFEVADYRQSNRVSVKHHNRIERVCWSGNPNLKAIIGVGVACASFCA